MGEDRQCGGHGKMIPDWLPVEILNMVDFP